MVIWRTLMLGIFISVLLSPKDKSNRKANQKPATQVLVDDWFSNFMACFKRCKNIEKSGSSFNENLTEPRLIRHDYICCENGISWCDAALCYCQNGSDVILCSGSFKLT